MREICETLGVEKEIEDLKNKLLEDFDALLNKEYIGVHRTVENDNWDKVKKLMNRKEDQAEETTINIISSGKTTTATLYENNKLVCSVVTEAPSLEEADTNVGVSVALKKLIEKATRLEDIKEIEKDLEEKPTKYNREEVKHIDDTVKCISDMYRNALITALGKNKLFIPKSKEAKYSGIVALKNNKVYYINGQIVDIDKVSFVDLFLLCELIAKEA